MRGRGVFLWCMAAACVSPIDEVPSTGAPTDGPPDTDAPPDTDLAEPPGLDLDGPYGQRLFQDEVAVLFEVELAGADLEELLGDVTDLREHWQEWVDHDYAYPWYPVLISIDGASPQSAHVRLKGESSLRESTGLQIPLKLDFNRDDAAGHFDGARAVHLNPPGGLGDYLGYSVMSAAGLTTPRAGFGLLTVNGEDWGHRLVVEHVGGRFLEHHVPGDSEGDLYKPNLPAGTLEWRGDRIEDYPNIGHREKPDTDHARVIEMIHELNLGDVEGVLDVPGAITYLAANVVLGNPDYAAEGRNYYLYARSDRFEIIPWDLNGVNLVVDHPCGRGRDPAGVDAPVYWALTDRLLGDAGFASAYFDKLAELLAGPASTERIVAIATKAMQVLPEVDDAVVGSLVARAEAREQLLFGAPLPVICPESTASP